MTLLHRSELAELHLSPAEDVLPTIATESAGLVVTDPPYDPEYAEALWSMGKVYPTPMVLLREVGRILRPGGRVAFLHHLVPALPPTLARLGTYGVSTGPGYRMRALSVLERPAQLSMDLGTTP